MVHLPPFEDARCKLGHVRTVESRARCGDGEVLRKLADETRDEVVRTDRDDDRQLLHEWLRQGCGGERGIECLHEAQDVVHVRAVVLPVAVAGDAILDVLKGRVDALDDGGALGLTQITRKLVFNKSRRYFFFTEGRNLATNNCGGVLG